MKHIRTGYILFFFLSGLLLFANNVQAGGVPDPTWVTGAADFEIWLSSSLTWDAGTLIASATLTDNNGETVGCTPGKILPDTTYRVQVVLKNNGDGDAKFKDAGDYVRHYNVKGSGTWAGTSPTLGNGAWKDFGSNNKDGYTCTTSWDGNNVHITNTSGQEVKIAKDGDTEGISYLITTDSDPATSSTSYWYSLGSASETEDSSKITITAAGDVHQNHYRWRGDSDGLNSQASGWLAAEDTAYTSLVKETTTRLRVEIANTGSASADDYQYLLEYSTSTSGPWTTVPVTASASEHFEMVASSQYSDGDNITGNFLTATGSWANGKGIEDPSNKTANYSLTNAYYTEFEYAIEATTDSTAGVTYYFRLTDDGSDTNFAYIKYPEVKIPGPDLDQNHYRWRADLEGLNSQASGWLAAEDTAYSPLEEYTPIRLRIEIANTGDASASNYQHLLEYSTSTSGPWTTVPVTATTEHFEMVASSQYADGDDITGNFLTATGTWANGKGIEVPSNKTANYSLTEAYYTELEYAIQATSNFTSGDTYYFRLTDDGSDLTYTYTRYPEVTMYSPSVTWETAAADFEIWLSSSSEWDAGSMVASATLTDDNGETVNCTAGQILPNTTYRVQVVLKNISAGDDIKFKTGADYFRHYNVKGSGSWAGTNPTLVNGAWEDFGSNNKDGFSYAASWDGNNVNITNTSGNEVKLAKNIGDTEGVSYLITTDSDPATSSTSYWYAIEETGIDQDSSKITITAGAAPVLDQNHYRWRADLEGLNTEAEGWLATEDNPYSPLQEETTIRLRIEIANTGTDSADDFQYLLEYSTDTGGPWTTVPVTASASEHFEMVDSSEYIDEANITSSFLTATNDWANGKGIEPPSNATANFDLTNAYYTEFEYAIEATTDFTPGETYYFRVTNNGSATNFSYPKYPELTMWVPPDADQNHYRWRADLDDLNNESNGWLAAEDTAYSPLAEETTIRLRVEIANTGGGSVDNYEYLLEYSTDTGGPWTTVPVTASASEHFEMVGSLYDDKENITGNFLNATGTWANGKGIEDPSNKTDNFSLTEDYYTEFEYAIQATTDSTGSETYYFRVTNDGSTTNFTYTRYPELTMATPSVFVRQTHYRWRNDDGGQVCPWYDTNWSRRKKITIDRTDVSDVSDPYTTYKDFPVLIYLTGLSNIKANGADIRFTSSDGVTELPREIEKYDTGTLNAWVKVTLTKDSSDSSNDAIYMYYDNSGATEPAADSTYGSENVWDANFVGVWHETNADDIDSTGTHDLTDVATVNQGDAYGKIDGGVEYDGDSGYQYHADASSLDITGSLTLEAWVYKDAANVFGIITKGDRTEANDDENYEIRTNNANKFVFKVEISGNIEKVVSSGSIDSTTWYHLVGTWDGTNMRLYINGSEDASSTPTGGDLSTNNYNLVLGAWALNSNFSNSRIDEARISNIARSADWIKTSHNNQDDPSGFLASVGSEETTTGGATWKAAEDEVSTRAKSSNVRLRFVVASTGTGSADNYQYLLEYATSTAGSWTAVPVTATTQHFEMTTTSQYADDDATTTQLTGTGSWAAGKCVEYSSNKTANYSLTNGYYTEIEYCFEATSNATDGEVYYFRLTNDGAALGVYDEYPELVVGVYVDASNSADFLTLGQDRRTFYDGTNYWSFYITDHNNLVYEKSTDGDVWPTPIQVNDSAANLTSLGIWEDGTDIYCCYTDGSTSYERKITIASGAMADERVFAASESSPVTIDADHSVVCVGGSEWGTTSIGSGDWESTSYRTGIDFDTTSIPDAVTITKVELKLYIDDEVTPLNNDVGNMTKKAYTYHVTDNDKSGFNSDVDGNQYLSNSGGYAGEYSYHTVELLAAARTDLEDQLGANWFSVGWTGTTEADSKYRDGHTYAEANPPQLIVTYTVAGVAGVASAHNHPQVIKDSAGNLWRKAEEGPTTPTFWVHKATDETNWGSDTQFGSDSSDYGHSMILPVESGNIMALYQDGNIIKWNKFSDPASQGSAANAVTDCATGASGAWDTTHYFSAVSDDAGYVYLIYVDSATGYIEYTLYDQSAGTWSSPTSVSDAASCSNPALFYDTDSETLFAFWISGTSAIKYKKYTGDWSASATTLKGSLTDSPAYLTTSYSHASKIGVMWRGDTSSAPPYTAYYETVSFGPTIVDLVSFEAIGYFGKVLVEWQTDSEINNTGFNVFRSEHPHYGFNKLNSALIPGLGNSAIGKEYRFWDDNVTDGITYYYILEDVELEGKSTLHGPVQAHPGLDSDGDGMTNDWENYYSLNPYDPADSSLDADADGLTNLEEFIQGKDPIISDISQPPSEPDIPVPSEPAPEGTDISTSPLEDDVKIIPSDDYGVVLELITSRFEIETKEVGDETYQVIKLPFAHGQTTEAGKPQIPVKGVLLGIPFDSAITFNLVSYEKEILSGYNLYPVPRIQRERNFSNKRFFTEGKIPGELTYKFFKDTNTYSRNGFYPDFLAEIAPVGSLRGQDAAKLNIYPIQFNPVTGELEFYKRIKLEVDFGKKADIDQENIHKSSTHFDKLYKCLFHNYGDVKSWKHRSRRYTQPDKFAPDSAYKISVNEEGIYRLTWQDLLYDAGLNPYWLDPRKIKMYNRGNQIPIYVAGQRDRWFDCDDYIEFYAEALNTRFTSTNIYWLITDGSRGQRMKTKRSFGARGQTPTSFLSDIHHEEDLMYWMEIPDKGYVDDHWFFSDSLWAPGSVDLVDFAIPLSDVADVEDEATLKIALQGISHGFSGPDHHTYIYLNGHLLDDATWDGDTEYIRQLNVPQSYFVEGDNIITVELPGDTGAEIDEVLANWFEVSYWRQFKAKGNALKFNNQGRGRYSYQISNFTENDIEIFDITNPKKVERIVRSVIKQDGGSYTVGFKDILLRGKNKDYLVLSPSGMKSPVSIVRDEPSNLRFRGNQADYIIITHEDFYDGILPLAEHRAEQGLSVKVVKVQDIYDEFNYGIFSPEAIKTFLKYTYSEWTKPAPTYVLLVGDGTYDYQDNEGLGCKNYVPTYMVHSLMFGETGSDNWFVCLDGEDDILPDMFIGRLPVYTSEQLDTIVSKTINYDYETAPSYETASSEDWTKKVTLVADNLEDVFVTTSEGLTGYLPDGYQINEIYLDNYANLGDCKPDIIDAINQGTLILNYVGHGAVDLWAHEYILKISDIPDLKNLDMLPFISTMTCANGYFVFPPGFFNCIAEELLYSPSGGAVAILAPTGVSYPDIQELLNKYLFESIFVENNSCLGAATTQARLSVFENAGQSGENVIQTFPLFGDPALELKR